MPVMQAPTCNGRYLPVASNNNIIVGLDDGMPPKKAQELTALEVRKLTKPGLHAVGGVDGLMLKVNASGSRSWILRYSTGERRQSPSGSEYAVRRDIGLGGFPDLGLKEARERAREIKAKLREGIDPVAEREAAREAVRAASAAEMTFAEAARACHRAKAPEFRNPKHAAQWLASLETYAFPVLGRMSVAEIQLPHVLRVLEPIWHEKTETANRVRGRIEAVLTWATVSGYRSGDNPARWEGNLKEVLPTPSKIQKKNHHRALPWQRVPEFMAALHEQKGLAARALEFLILTAARSGEVRHAAWGEFDLSGRTWTVPADRIKAGKEHQVPLSDTAIALLDDLPTFEGSEFAFPAPRGGALSDMALTAVVRRMGYDCTVHGFRSSFKDWARNRTAYPDEVSELQLAHVNSDATRAAYARDGLLPQRAQLMADWAQFVREGLPEGAEVTAIGEGQA